MPRMNSTKGFDQMSGQGGNSANYIQRKNLKLQKLINQANATPLITSSKKSANEHYESRPPEAGGKNTH